MNRLHSTDLIELARQFFERERTVNDAAAEFTRDELCSFAREMSAEMENTVRDLTPEQIAYRLPGKPAGWDSSGDEAEFDTSEIVTHVAVGVAFYWFGIARGLGHGRPQFPRAPRGTNVTGKTGSVLGRGGWSGVPGSELASLLHDMMHSFLGYVETLPAEQMETKTVYEGYGELTVNGWLLLLAAHLDLHLKQLKTMQSQPDYPYA
ncbi:MAG TPA: DinB family protein [Chloroflexia bacterium]|nr:DinB family protein [Chloroflexia bacterium]